MKQTTAGTSVPNDATTQTQTFRDWCSKHQHAITIATTAAMTGVVAYVCSKYGTAALASVAAAFNNSETK
jgi:hypothetical protein